jgi:type VI secretion system FHA domain protein
VNEVEDNETEWFGMQEVQAPKQAMPERVVREAVNRVHPTPIAQPPVKRTPPPVMKQPTPVQSVPDSGSAQLKLLLEAAGISGVTVSDATATTLGEVLRTAVEGLMEVLRARERAKDELRMRGTTFQSAHNNPLKFSANADDAFHNLLVKQNRAYLSPQQAFEDAFADVRDHQAALLAAMRVAFETMLAQFDPERLQEEFDRQVRKGSILGVPAKLRYWDLYRDKYAELAQDAHGSFRTLFGEEFGKAYEAQLERFKTLGPAEH